VVRLEELRSPGEIAHASRAVTNADGQFQHAGAVFERASLGDPEQLRRWRLILGKDAQAPLDGMGACRLSGGDAEMDEAEFFAVASECFFDRPVKLERRHPQLYSLLRDYFHQDPAARCKNTDL